MLSDSLSQGYVSSRAGLRRKWGGYEPKLQNAGDFLETCPASSDNHSMGELSRFSFCMGLVRSILLAPGGRKSVCMPSGRSLFEAVDVIRECVKVNTRVRKMDVRRVLKRNNDFFDPDAGIVGKDIIELFDGNSPEAGQLYYGQGHHRSRRLEIT